MEQLSDDRQIIHLEETESTNSYLKELIKSEQLVEGSVVVADFQTAGRGQVGIRGFRQGDNLLSAADLSHRNSCQRAVYYFADNFVGNKNTLDQFTDDIHQMAERYLLEG